MEKGFWVCRRLQLCGARVAGNPHRIFFFPRSAPNSRGKRTKNLRARCASCGRTISSSRPREPLPLKSSGLCVMSALRWLHELYTLWSVNLAHTHFGSQICHTHIQNTIWGEYKHWHLSYWFFLFLSCLLFILAGHWDFLIARAIWGESWRWQESCEGPQA